MSTLPLLLLASLVGFVSYAIWRWFEMVTKDTDWEVFIDVVSIFAAMLLSGPIVLLVIMHRGFLVVLGTLALGAWMHQRSGGASRNIFMASILMTMSLLGSLVLGMVAVLTLFPSSITNLSTQAGLEEFDRFGLFLSACWLYTLFAPIVPWVWRSLRVRPGVDEALPEEPIA